MANEEQVSEQLAQAGNAWFEFRIEETAGRGVDIDKLARVLQDLSAAFYTIARAKLGKPNRPGPHTADEQALASIRVLRVLPGSAVIEAEPPVEGMQPRLEMLPITFTADDIASDLVEEMQRISMRTSSSFTRPDVRQRVQTLLKGAGEIGGIAEAILRPRLSVNGTVKREVRTRMPTTIEMLDEAHAASQPRQRRVAGHAYMVDVEPGRWRIRLKLPDGRDLTLDASEGLANQLKQAVDQAVEIQSVEELVGDQVASRTAVGLQILETSGSGSDRPPKTIRELALEQGMPIQRPDYRALASVVWESEDDIAEFDVYLSQVRRSSLV